MGLLSHRAQMKEYHNVRAHVRILGAHGPQISEVAVLPGKLFITPLIVMSNFITCSENDVMVL